MTQQINLLEPSLLPKREWCTGRVIVAVAGVLAVAVGAHYMHESAGIKRALAAGSPAPSDAAASAENSDPIEAQLRDGQSRLARGEMLMKAVAGLTDLPRDNARRLQALIAAMPDTVWLQEVEFSGERAVRIVGGATQSAALAGFSQSLGATKEFEALPLHVYALAPRDTEPPAQPQPGDDAKEERAPAPAPQYRFVLSSVDAERAAHKEAQ
jgi:hypothetical protein